MSEGASFIDFHSLMGIVYELHARRLTGMLFAATDDNKMARLQIVEGEISSVVFMRQRGSKALILLNDIGPGRVRFQEGVVIDEIGALNSDLPATEQIFYLYGEKPSPALTPQGEGSQNDAKTTVSNAQRAALEAALAEYVGPVAMLLVEEHLNDERGIDQVIDALALEIGDSGQAKQFRVDARTQIDRIKK